MRILIIEDDSSMAESIKLMLEAAQMNVDIADCGGSAVDLARVYRFDAILLDMNLPDMNGMEALREVRATGCRAPVLVVSGVDGVEARVKALRAGADDYLTKPFHRNELTARINAVVRRWRGYADSEIRVGNMTLDLDEKIARVDGRPDPVNLTRSEYLILELLCLRKGATISKETMLESLYSGASEPGAKIIDVFVCKLRKKLQAATGGINYIQTVWGHGYALGEPPEAQAA